MSTHSEKLPRMVEKYFWDCNFEELTIALHGDFIVERILNFGDDNAVRWLFDHTTSANIKKVAQHSRNLSEKTRNFWHIMMS